MRRIASVYLAGPDPWFPDAADHAQRKRDLCEAAGFIGVTPFDTPLVETEPSEVMAREIYADNVSRLRMCDAVIANLTPWRGPSCDPGTAFEMGFASALKLPVFAYMNVADEEDADYRGRVELASALVLGADGRIRDADGCEIEDFGLPENLMLWAEARRLLIVVTPDIFGDLTGLEMALEAIQEYDAL